MQSNLNETLIPLGEARRKHIPKSPSGKPISPATLWRWINQGLMNSDGNRVKLRVVKIGVKSFLTHDTLNDFFEKLISSDECQVERSPEEGAINRRLRDAKLVEPEEQDD